MKKWLLFLVSAALLVSADQPVKDAFVLSREYAVTIEGTSNLRDWHEKVGDVTGNMTAIVNADGSVELSSIRIRMKPPSALFGTMRAGPDITIHFNTNFINQSILTNLKN